MEKPNHKYISVFACSICIIKIGILDVFKVGCSSSEV